MERRFWSKVGIRGPDDCWPWLLYCSRDGYGRFSANGKTLEAHRVAWEFSCGPIPEGICVCHHCDNPPCCNPDHLFLGTRADNNEDRDEKGRSSGGALYGKDHPQCKLSDEDVRTIRKLHSEGVVQKELAHRYGVSRGYMSLLVNGMRRTYETH